MRVLTFTFGELLTNTYFCVDPSGAAAVIDPGMDGEAVWEKLRQKGLSPTHILLTHGHFDHSRGVKFLKEKTGAEVLVHRDDAALLTDPYKSAASFYYRGSVEDYPFCAADRLLEDGDEILCGETCFRVLHTPGHTPGSVCYLAEEVLFCGDTVFAYGFGRTDLYGGSPAALAVSLRRILGFEGDLKLCPGHGNSTHLALQREAIARSICQLEGE